MSGKDNILSYVKQGFDKEENIKVDKTEQLDVQWIELDKVKSMNKEMLRGFDTALNDIKNMENGKIYPLDLFDNKIYKR